MAPVERIAWLPTSNSKPRSFRRRSEVVATGGRRADIEATSSFRTTFLLASKAGEKQGARGRIQQD